MRQRIIFFCAISRVLYLFSRYIISLIRIISFSDKYKVFLLFFAFSSEKMLFFRYLIKVLSPIWYFFERATIPGLYISLLFGFSWTRSIRKYPIFACVFIFQLLTIFGWGSALKFSIETKLMSKNISDFSGIFFGIIERNLRNAWSRIQRFPQQRETK